MHTITIKTINIMDNTNTEFRLTEEQLDLCNEMFLKILKNKKKFETTTII